MDYKSQTQTTKFTDKLQKTTKVGLRLQGLMKKTTKVGLRLQGLMIDYK